MKNNIMKNIYKIVLLLIICSYTGAYAQEVNKITPVYDGNVVTLNVNEQGNAGEVLTV